MACTHIDSCPLFPFFNMRATLGVWKAMYCQSNFEGCARLELTLAGEVVPWNLLPNGKKLDIPHEHLR